MNFGEDYGKMVVIVDMLDINRVLVDTPDGSMPRLVYPVKRLTLTKLRVKDVLRGCRSSTLKKLAAKQDIVTSFKKTSSAMKIARSKTRTSLTDFEKFKVMVLRKQRSWKKNHLNEKAPVKKAPPKKEAAKKDVPPSPGKKGGKGGAAAKGGDVPPSPSGGKKGKKGKKGQAEG